jgi:hypothetical protein
VFKGKGFRTAHLCCESRISGSYTGSASGPVGCRLQRWPTYGYQQPSFFNGVHGRSPIIDPNDLHIYNDTRNSHGQAT